jgi:hypothetical protein
MTHLFQLRQPSKKFERLTKALRFQRSLGFYTESKWIFATTHFLLTQVSTIVTIRTCKEANYTPEQLRCNCLGLARRRMRL